MFTTDPILDAILSGLVLAVLALGWMNLLIRLNGLRTLSKMTNFDFVTTVAFGSLLAGAGQASDWLEFGQACAVMTGLVLAQAVTGWLRRRSNLVAAAVGNQPCLIMRDGKFLDDAIGATGMRREDVVAKLREANVLDLSSVRAAILETTGDVSVLHGGNEVDPLVLCDVRGA